MPPATDLSVQTHGWHGASPSHASSRRWCAMHTYLGLGMQELKRSGTNSNLLLVMWCHVLNHNESRQEPRIRLSRMIAHQQSNGAYSSPGLGVGKILDVRCPTPRGRFIRFASPIKIADGSVEECRNLGIGVLNLKCMRWGDANLRWRCLGDGHGRRRHGHRSIAHSAPGRWIVL